MKFLSPGGGVLSLMGKNIMSREKGTMMVVGKNITWEKGKVEVISYTPKYWGGLEEYWVGKRLIGRKFWGRKSRLNKDESIYKDYESSIEAY